MNEEVHETAPAVYAVIGLGFGILGVLTWLLFPVGLPVALLGLYFSIRSLNSRRRKMGMVATVLCVLSLALTFASVGISYYVVKTGRPRILSQWMQSARSIALEDQQKRLERQHAEQIKKAK